MTDDMMGSAEAAAYLGLSRQYLNKLVQDGEIVATRRGRYWWFRREDLDNRRASDSVPNTTKESNADELFSPGEAAAFLGIVRQRLTQLRETGVIPAERHGMMWMYRRADLEKRKAANPGSGRPKR